jgi:hypothetical protein
MAPKLPDRRDLVAGTDFESRHRFQSQTGRLAINSSEIPQSKMAEVLAATTEIDPVQTAEAIAPMPSLPSEALPLQPKTEIAALESRAINATFWTIVQYGCGQGLRLVNSFILTRLLFPEAFGQMTLVTTLIVGITMLSDLGLGPSVIQSRRGDEPAFLNTAWTLQVMRGTGLWLFALLLARRPCLSRSQADAGALGARDQHRHQRLQQHQDPYAFAPHGRTAAVHHRVHHADRCPGRHHHVRVLLAVSLGFGRRQSGLDAL